MRHLTAARILVATGTVVAVVAIVAVWVSRQALETDAWTETSSALLEQPALRTAVADYLVDELYANFDVAGELRRALPERADPLAAPAANALRGIADDAARQALGRPRVQAAWEQANRRAHVLLLDVVLDGGGGTVSSRRGVVTLDLRALLTQLAERVGVGSQLVGRLPPGAAKVEILRADQLSTAQSVARAIEPLTLALLLAVLACFGTAVAVARGHRREIVRDAGLGLVLAGAATLVIRELAGAALVDELATTAAMKPAITDVWRVGTSLLTATATAVISYGALTAAGAWLAGPARAAVAVRAWLAPYLRDARLTYCAFAAIVALVLVWGPTEATRRAVPALVLIALAVAGVEALRRQVRAEFPNATRRAGAPGARAFLSRARQLLEDRRAVPAGDAARAPAPLTDGTVAQLERLDRLHQSGGLDEKEFQAAKGRVLSAT